MSIRPFNFFRVLFLLSLIVGTAWIIRKHQSSQWKEASGEIFGTYYTVKYESANDLNDEILDTLRSVDRSLSMFNPTSTISRVNRNETDRTDVALSEVLRTSLSIYGMTDGAFDVTVAPLVDAWGFGLRDRDSVSPSLIDSLMHFVGSDKVRLTRSGRIVKADSRVRMDFSAIAKGYGVDRVARLLEQRGVSNYSVWIGGEMRLRGCNPEGTLWNIGIQNPVGTNGASPTSSPQIVVSLTDCALATSGDYLRYYVQDGRKVSHTIHPKTGYPAGQSLLSATVRTADCTTADALATAFMTMGTEAALRFLDAHADIAAYLISDENGKLVVHRRGKW